MNSPAKSELRRWLEIGAFVFSLTGNNSKHLENQRARHHLFIIKMLQIVAGAIGRALFYNSLIVWVLLNTGCYIGHLDRLVARHSMVAEPVEIGCLQSTGTGG